MNSRMKRRRRGWLKRATAVVELALIMPVMIGMVVGTLEFGWQLTVRQVMTGAARQAARYGALEDASLDQISTEAKNVLDSIKIKDKCTVTVTDATQLSPQVTVQISVPQSQITLVGNYFHFPQGTITVKTIFPKEGMN